MADYSSSKKTTKTTKRTDRSSRLAERSQNNINLIEQSEEKSSSDPYQCTGKFFEDFQMLCRQNQINFIPPILNRVKRAVTPTPIDTAKEKTKVHSKRTTQTLNFDSQSMTQSDLFLGTSSQKQQSQGTLNEQSEDTKDADGEPLPKTFVLVKDRFEYFKPKLQVEYEHPEKSDNVSELYVRGWKIETPMMNILQQCLPRSEKLVTINLWFCGLNEETLDILANFLPKCLNLKNLSLDGNPICEENYYKLISDDSLLQSLSLRNCQITDSGAEKLGHALGSVYAQNKKLLMLNLSLNYITDKGAIEIAKGLRINRTLLVLNLSGNQIGDIGANKFAETLSKLKMTHEEIVKRRSIKREQIIKETSPASRKTKSEANDRPQSMAQNKTLKDTKASKKDRQENTVPIGRDRSKSKDQALRDTLTEKPSNSKLKSKEKDSNSSILVNNTQKKDKNARDLASSISTDKTSKTLKTKNSKSKLKDSDNENENLRSSSGGKILGMNQILSIEVDPLMDEAETIDGDIWLAGNRTLISLNLSRNKITLIGVRDFLLCIQYQVTINLIHKSSFTNGLLKLNLTKNDFEVDNEYFVKLNELLKSRDPIANKTNEILIERDNVSVISKDGKDTSRSKSGKSMLKNMQ